MMLENFIVGINGLFVSLRVTEPTSHCHSGESWNPVKTITDVIARTAISREKQSIFIRKQYGLLRFANDHTRNDGAGVQIRHNSEQRTK